LKNGLKQDIKVYCILDSDYHSQINIEERHNEAKEIGVILHIWQKKEIENYLLSSTAILRILQRNTRTTKPLSLQIIENKLIEIVEGMKTEITDKFADEIQATNRKWKPSTVNSEARKKVESLWSDKMSIVSGKEVLNKFNNWCGQQYKTSVTVNGLARELYKEEIPSEMQMVITAIERNQIIE
jgi:hypothetical protein